MGLGQLLQEAIVVPSKKGSEKPRSDSLLASRVNCTKLTGRLSIGKRVKDMGVINIPGPKMTIVTPCKGPFDRPPYYWLCLEVGLESTTMAPGSLENTPKQTFGTSFPSQQPARPRFVALSASPPPHLEVVEGEPLHVPWGS